jgi:hypothetical protein
MEVFEPAFARLWRNATFGLSFSRFNARMTPIRAIMVGPPRDTISKTSIAVAIPAGRTPFLAAR